MTSRKTPTKKPDILAMAMRRAYRDTRRGIEAKAKGFDANVIAADRSTRRIIDN